MVILVVTVFAYGEVKVRLDHAKYWREVAQWEVENYWDKDENVINYDHWGRIDK